MSLKLSHCTNRPGVTTLGRKHRTLRIGVVQPRTPFLKYNGKYMCKIYASSRKLARNLISAYFEPYQWG